MPIIPFNSHCYLERKQIFPIEEKEEPDSPLTNIMHLWVSSQPSLPVLEMEGLGL